MDISFVLQVKSDPNMVASSHRGDRLMHHFLLGSQHKNSAVRDRAWLSFTILVKEAKDMDRILMQ